MNSTVFVWQQSLTCKIVLVGLQNKGKSRWPATSWDFQKTKQFVAVHLDLPLSWKSHGATCVPACVLLYHVTGSCEGSIVISSHLAFFFDKQHLLLFISKNYLQTDCVRIARRTKSKNRMQITEFLREIQGM